MNDGSIVLGDDQSITRYIITFMLDSYYKMIIYSYQSDRGHIYTQYTVHFTVVNQVKNK